MVSRANRDKSIWQCKKKKENKKVIFFSTTQMLFVAQTSKAYCWKKLADVFQNNLKTVSFEITPNGMRLQRLDSNQRILIYMDLKAEYFDFFRCSVDSISVGLSPEHFHSMLKGVKKKDSIELRINNDKPEDFVIMIRSSDPNMGRTTTSRLHT